MCKEISSYLSQKSPVKGLLLRREMKSCPSKSSLSRLSQPLTALPLKHKICEWQSLCSHRSTHPSSTIPVIPWPLVTNHLHCSSSLRISFHRKTSFHRTTQLSSCITSLPTIRMAEEDWSLDCNLSDEFFPLFFFSFIVLFRERIFKDEVVHRAHPSTSAA